ncbi:hypothetical protein OO007_19490 [Cocleimonas sp. KMM 6892]|uniref:poly(R)-hydroxyalkanoic acid synthase subunit PhaE n=1 Tax=unclassified Cocleimonas TaxID=2639732 RepID=UPI002DBE80E1|nr:MULTISPECIES: poly(R)-hydroxyalkanoic acid synthase subunit PhaE [unclassified Cocleimonas]MEB8434432.1 hypothetical protein [Cocleimonas sp. KMM 6892]MEC4717325.1 hypothetical protein [Cocleimonas sp. KMM 6895]MEC4746704.1 hypothetical protein [Cocleimonas sp. KMM 6896]
MVENTSFNDEWNKLQKRFWDNVGSSFTPSVANGDDITPSPQHSLFNQWLNTVDKCWQDHAEVSSGDIDALYNKVYSSSRFFINFSETLHKNPKGETADVLMVNYLKEFTENASVSATGFATAVDTSTKNNIDGNSESTLDSSLDSSLVNTSDSVSEESKAKTNHHTQQESKQADFSAMHQLWQLPMANWQQQATFFTSQNQSLKALADYVGDAAKNPEFSAALEAYLVALQELQQLFFKLMINVAKLTVEALQKNTEQPLSAKQILSLWLEYFDTQYLDVIATESYSLIYAKVINSWLLVIDKSDKTFAEFMQDTVPSSPVSSSSSSNNPHQ